MDTEFPEVKYDSGLMCTKMDPGVCITDIALHTVPADSVINPEIWFRGSSLTLTVRILVISLKSPLL